MINYSPGDLVYFTKELSGTSWPRGVYRGTVFAVVKTTMAAGSEVSYKIVCGDFTVDVSAADVFSTPAAAFNSIK